MCGHARGVVRVFEGYEDGNVMDITVCMCGRCERFYDKLDAKGKPSAELVVWRESFGGTLDALGLT